MIRIGGAAWTKDGILHAHVELICDVPNEIQAEKIAPTYHSTL